jgi:integrase
VARLVAAAEAAGPGWFGLAVRVQAESGCRTSELLGLRWDWWAGRWWEIPPHEHKTGAKTGKARVVAVTATTAARLDDLRAGASSGCCFKGEGRGARFAGRPPSASRYASAFRKLAAAVGLPDARPYCLRDHFADAARRAGVAPHVAARVQGHSAEVSAAHYQTLAGEEAAEVVERVAGGG